MNHNSTHDKYITWYIIHKSIQLSKPNKLLSSPPGFRRPAELLGVPSRWIMKGQTHTHTHIYIPGVEIWRTFNLEEQASSNKIIGLKRILTDFVHVRDNCSIYKPGPTPQRSFISCLIENMEIELNSANLVAAVTSFIAPQSSYTMNIQ